MGEGFFEPLGELTMEGLDNACEAAFQNAGDLLDEADLLREHGKCARAYFLAHIACEELGKLPILAHLAVALKLGNPVDWKRVDRQLRSHDEKIKRVLFMDSIVTGRSTKEGGESYEEDVKRLRLYTDAKNATLYSFHAGGEFVVPQGAVGCDFFDQFRAVARGRLKAFEQMYIRLIRDAGGLRELFNDRTFARTEKVVERLLGHEGEAAFSEYAKTGDESKLREFMDRLLTEPIAEHVDGTDA